MVLKSTIKRQTFPFSCSFFLLLQDVAGCERRCTCWETSLLPCCLMTELSFHFSTVFGHALQNFHQWSNYNLYFGHSNLMQDWFELSHYNHSYHDLPNLILDWIKKLTSHFPIHNIWTCLCRTSTSDELSTIFTLVVPTQHKSVLNWTFITILVTYPNLLLEQKKKTDIPKRYGIMLIPY